MLKHLGTFEHLFGLLPLSSKIIAILFGNCLLRSQNRTVDDLLLHLFSILEAVFAGRPAAHGLTRSLRRCTLLHWTVIGHPAMRIGRLNFLVQIGIVLLGPIVHDPLVEVLLHDVSSTRFAEHLLTIWQYLVAVRRWKVVSSSAHVGTEKGALLIIVMVPLL